MKRTFKALLSGALFFIAINPSLDAQLLEPGKQTLVVYQGGYSVMQDIRQIDLQRGRNEILLSGFPMSMDFSSLIPGINGRVTDLRFNDRVNNYGSIVESLIGKSVRLEPAAGPSITGILRQVSPGLIVVEQRDESRVILPSLDKYAVTVFEPVESTRMLPELAVTLEASRGGAQNLTLSYLLSGLSWSNEYALVLAGDEKTARLSGWTMVSNQNDWHFKDVELKLIAGQMSVSRKFSYTPDTRLRGTSQAAMSFEAAIGDNSNISAAPLGDMHLYEVPGVYDLKPMENRRIQMLEADGIEVTRRYRFTSTDRFTEFATGGQVRVQYDIANSDKNNLGKPIPSGILKIYRMLDGQRIIAGEDNIANIARGGMLTVTSGLAFDILVRENMIAQTRISDRIFEQISEVELQNRKDEPIEVEVERLLQPNQKFINTSVPVEMVSSNRGVAKVKLNPGQDLKISFMIRTER